MKTAVLILILIALASPAAAKLSPRWKAYATCAAAYRVNAAIADPGRSASMKSQISETAAEYEVAAVERYRLEMAADEPTAKAKVAAYVRARAPGLRKQTREAVEHVIDTCPQTST